MPKNRYYIYLFRAAAIWSWLIAIGAYTGDTVNIPLFRNILPSVEPRIFLDMAVLPIFLFGFAFWGVSRDLTRNHLIIVVGGVGSILAFTLFVFRYLTGDIPFLFLLAAVVDLIFGILMLECWYWARRNQKSRIA